MSKVIGISYLIILTERNDKYILMYDINFAYFGIKTLFKNTRSVLKYTIFK